MIRAYRKEDQSDIIELLRLNTPLFFHDSEKKELQQYLENEIEDYFV